MKNFMAFALGILLVSQSCNMQKESTLGQDPIIQKTFSTDEIQYLGRILALYQEKILKYNPDESDFVLAYKSYLNHLCEYGDLVKAFREAGINEDNYKEIYDLMIESGLFDSFYPADTLFVDTTTGRSTGITRSDSIARIFRTIPQFGKYAEFLIEMSATDTVYAYHHSTLMVCGGIPPSYIGRMLCFSEVYQLEDPKVQLFYMITLLEPLWFSQ